MKLLNNKYNFNFSFDDDIVNVLVCENARVYNDLIVELYKSECNINSSFVLSDKEKIIDFNNNCEIIFNPFKLDINNRKNIERLYLELSKLMSVDEMFIKKNELFSNIFMYINKLSMISDFDITYNDRIDDKNLLKLVGISLDNEGLFIDKLLNYIKITNMLQGNKIYILVNLKSFVSSNDILRIYRDIEYNKYNVLLLENIDNQKIGNENKIIIDKDCCIIR